MYTYFPRRYLGIPIFDFCNRYCAFLSLFKYVADMVLIDSKLLRLVFKSFSVHYILEYNCVAILVTAISYADQCFTGDKRYGRRVMVRKVFTILTKKSDKVGKFCQISKNIVAFMGC
ncbi:hypothetical protein PHYBLDRAFT_60172 [Phycomyces blakesleeanus NRRL 1555(-)]|uniref:Uncharacterized protein n=1 Tax=Phycomyces blakesleeanus (strain ATCC 8743b / DSM 1359 / FGSC 10004 / NBRC 33097 / NRRL 1555) TaxID=763407 RepID=A0A162TQJ0_PHYB8|nr:hypothetical protein PHYBLDRAFT_60172 [Phycomyces blakesleeanus NRRL 1555(-)]OAD70272.1 hypothetical protein PHYBLDRAFT_60172 [Phycomyces blakesleeanus NRRL 1555(-)]|eukprot:XP_018288312.1 hypothetical protein PHYBLDRAFT_60172 [Phycomyces blakesleeanus NRRL 1555(-)]